jgi:hypothetical protein
MLIVDSLPSSEKARAERVPRGPVDTAGDQAFWM